MSEGSPESDIYRLNGEFVRPKTEDGSIENSIFMQLFKDQNTTEQTFSANKFSKVVSQLTAPNSHAHPYKSETSSMELNYSPKGDRCQQMVPSALSTPGNSYVGGPNITPLYNKITGELVIDSNRSDSSSTSSGTDSSPTHSQYGRYETNGPAKKESVRLGKDEKIAKQAGIRLSVKQDIVNPPMDEFNDMLSKEDLTEEQLNICRDIRRRGKNKVAAQNCRKRKLEQIDELQERLDESKRRQYRLHVQHEKLVSTYSSEANKLTQLTNLVLAHNNKDPNQFLVKVDGEEVKILPKSAVPEKDRIPKPVSTMQLNYMTQYPSTQQYYSSDCMEQQAMSGWTKCNSQAR